ncbi:MAG: hypothetical protein WD873_02395 [Candidatus Hydrogenedentales bacterium]
MTKTALFELWLAIAVLVGLGMSGAAYAQHCIDPEEPGIGPDPRVSTTPVAPLLDGLGDHRFQTSTKNEQAQRFFDQGLRLSYAFNHREALRAFNEAIRLDPEFAMAYWGQALVLGPNLNMAMQEESIPHIWSAIEEAQKFKANASERERDHIEALAKRYSPDPKADRAALDQAYADAMRALVEKYPDDLDAATLYASALMNQTPWNYWLPDGQPRATTDEILSTLESVIERDWQHPGGHHYYIHAVEASDDPFRAIPSADRLTDLMPSAGHMVHMPSHIYVRVGRYKDASDANVRAVAADENYIQQCTRQGIYPLAYYPHNIHFLAYAAMLEGASQKCLDASRKVAEQVPPDMAEDYWALYQTFLAMPLFTQVRFGKWDAILEADAPAEQLVYLRVLDHYARGLAYTRQGDYRKAKKELDALRALENNERLQETAVGFAGGPMIAEIADNVLAGELAAARKDYEEAIRRLDRAMRLEDSLVYNEPPEWCIPVRQHLGAVLIEAGFPDEAETVYWQDLKENPANGWSLFGLMQALEAQGKNDQAAEIEQRFKTAWAGADIELTNSRF